MIVQLLRTAVSNTKNNKERAEVIYSFALVNVPAARPGIRLEPGVILSGFLRTVL